MVQSGEPTQDRHRLVLRTLPAIVSPLPTQVCRHCAAVLYFLSDRSHRFLITMASGENTSAVVPSGIGLLHEAGNPSTATWYTNRLVYSPSLLKKPKVFWEAACKDAGGEDKAEEYVKNLSMKMTDYMEKDHVFDRTTLQSEIKKTLKDAKRMTLLLGPKSIGKTQVLSAVARDLMEQADSPFMVVYVNARKRSAGSLRDGIESALQSLAVGRSGFFKNVNWKEVGESLAGLLRLSDKTKKYGDAFEHLTNLTDAMNLCGSENDVVADTNYVNLLITIAAKKNKKPCLIIDEANLFLKGGDAEDPLIHQFLHLTKEEGSLKVFLCSSKHSYPSQLKKSGLQLSLVDLSYALEPSPQAMFSFLTIDKEDDSESKIIGMGNALATLTISLAGGHVPTIKNLLLSLAEKKQDFRGISVLHNLEGAQEIRQVLLNDNSEGHMREILKELARKGYAFDKNYDCSPIVDNSIAGRVDDGFRFIGDGFDTKSILDNYLMPSSCALRNLIACYVESIEPANRAHGNPQSPQP